jgi:hypothetical protein
LSKIDGLKGQDQSTSACIECERSFAAGLARVLRGEVQLALITNEISISEVKTICRSGHTVPNGKITVGQRFLQRYGTNAVSVLVIGI